MITGETARKIERDIFKYLDGIKEKKGFTNVRWGKEAFNGELNSKRKIQNFKKPQVNGKTQQLRVADLIRLCEPLGIDPAKALAKVLSDNGL